MRKIKISELPLYSSLKGLFTVGTDNQNRSVKVSLEFVEETTNEAAEYAKTHTDTAVANAETATAAANTAAAIANQKATAAQTAADACNTATTKANDATAAANTATTNAVAATEAAVTATANANTATTNAVDATADCIQATQDTVMFTHDTIQAKTETEKATAAILSAYSKLIPTGIEITCLERITIGNLSEKYITTTLFPTDTMHNVIYQSDNRSIAVAPDGRISVLAKGISTVHVIPICNTTLAKSVVIEVGDPTMRLVNTRNCLRFTSSGALRFN